MSLSDDYALCLVPYESAERVVGSHAVCAVCHECGAVVADQDKHSEYHSRNAERIYEGRLQ